MASSKVEVLEAKSSKLRKELIAAIDERNFAKEKVKALIVDIVFCPPLICMTNLKKSKNIIFSTWGREDT